MMSTPTPLYKAVFPDYDDELPVLVGWDDISWKNDVCPSIGRRTEVADEYDLILYVDYKDPSKRELEGQSVARYSITDSRTGSDLFATDSWEEIRLFIALQK